ncbi:MAG: DNA polymerase III subunit gamma/tau [Deltaproteobacteria bacterium]|nr:DNA polymerase III subunit gamma/tau [Deltaproteobacteria bacterium]
MEYLAIARKWRPQEFGDLVGQAHVVQTLKNAIRLGRVSHAYLFCGARGVGKTSVARIFAKSLRCTQPIDGVACHKCTECIAIAESRSVDVVEIDGASNNGVEAVRSLRENVAYGAATGAYKIYIIDEVHMLSLSAFNALLKTLEEPPPYVVFIFATTEVQKIPQTILSRCQRFEFRRLTQGQIVERLNQVLTAEQITLSEEGVRLLASHADGSLRDGLSLLDQVLSYFGPSGNRTFDEAAVVEALGVHGTAEIRGFLSDVLGKNIPGLLTRIETAYVSGMDLKNFAEHCLEDLRLLYLVVLARDARSGLSSESLDISPQHLIDLQKIAEHTELVAIERMAQILSKTIDQLGWCAQPRFALEMAAVRMTKLDRLEEMESFEALPTAAASAGPAAGQPTAAPAPIVRHSQPPQNFRPAPTPAPTGAQRPTGPPNFSESREVQGDPRDPRNEMRSASADPQTAWKGFVETVIKKRPLLGALLYHANFEITTEGNARTITLAFPAGSFYERQASEGKNRKEIEDNLKTFFGPSTHFILNNEPLRARPSLEAARMEEEKKLRDEALSHPSVLKTKEIFQAEVIEVNLENRDG